MENFGFKGLLVTLYQRVLLSYKSTLVGIGILAAAEAVQYLTHSPNKTLSTIAAVAAGVLALVKERYPVPPSQPKLVE